MNLSRRNLLKILLFGGLAAVLGKILGRNFFQAQERIGRENAFGDFKVVETKEGLIFLDKETGEEVLIIEK